MLESPVLVLFYFPKKVLPSLCFSITFQKEVWTVSQSLSVKIHTSNQYFPGPLKATGQMNGGIRFPLFCHKWLLSISSMHSCIQWLQGSFPVEMILMVLQRSLLYIVNICLFFEESTFLLYLISREPRTTLL